MPSLSRRPAWAPDGAKGVFASREISGVTAHTANGPLPPPRRCSPAEIASAVLAGNRSGLSRAITLVESNAPAHRTLARELLQRIAEKPGDAVRVGISGPPGAGKSTFIEALGNHLCDAGHRVAVLAVDPSSTLSGGSILGDKTRMETLCHREECFIRPSPSGGALGGVARKTRETIALCEAAGHDIVLVETVGVGQSEIAVRGMVDCFVLLLISGAGDALQGMKKGIIEIADILVVNKADGANKERALAARKEFAGALSLLTSETAGWNPPVLAASSVTRDGIPEVWESVTRYLSLLHADGRFAAQRRRQSLAWWRSLVEQELHSRFLRSPRISRLAGELEQQVVNGTLPPSIAAEELLARFQP